MIFIKKYVIINYKVKKGLITMKTLQVSYTYLDLVEVPDDMTYEAIRELIAERAPAPWWHEFEFFEVKEEDMV